MDDDAFFFVNFYKDRMPIGLSEVLLYICAEMLFEVLQKLHDRFRKIGIAVFHVDNFLGDVVDGVNFLLQLIEVLIIGNSALFHGDYVVFFLISHHCQMLFVILLDGLLNVLC